MDIEYYLARPDEINIGDRAYFEGDLPGRPEDFLTVTKIERQNGGFFFHVAENKGEPFAINETELVPILVEIQPIHISEAIQKKAARNSIAGLVANAPEVIETYKNLLAAMAELDDPARAVQLLDMVIATGLPGAERRISTITSVCPNGHQETADIPENAGPQDVIECLAELRGPCPQCETFEDYQELMQSQAELAVEALNPEGLDPLAPEE
jgi:hypothetical protein